MCKPCKPAGVQSSVVPAVTLGQLGQHPPTCCTPTHPQTCQLPPVLECNTISHHGLLEGEGYYPVVPTPGLHAGSQFSFVPAAIATEASYEPTFAPFARRSSFSAVFGLSHMLPS